MPSRKQPPEATKPAFVVADAKHTDYLGLTKADWFSAFVIMGIFAGRFGQALLETEGEAELKEAAGTARRMGELMVAGSGS